MIKQWITKFFERGKKIKKTEKNERMWMKSRLLYSLCFLLQTGALFSWTFNSDAAGNAVNAPTNAATAALTSVGNNSKFEATAFDEVNNVLYVGGDATPPANHAVMAVTFDNGVVNVKDLTQVGAALASKKCNILQVLPNGDLLVGIEGFSNFYIIKNPLSSTPSLVSSPAATDGAGAAGVNVKFKNISFAGTNSTNKYRIVGVIPSNNNGFNHDDDNHVMQTYVYDPDAATIAAVAGLEKKISLTNAGDAAGLKSQVGQCDGGVANYTGFHWDNDLKCLYFGVTIAADTGGQNHSFLTVARFAEDSNASPNNLTFASFVPKGNNENIFSLNQVNTEYNIHNVKTLKTATGKTYLVVQLDHEEIGNQSRKNSRSIYAIPVADGATGGALGTAANVDANTVINRDATAANATNTYATFNSLSDLGASLLADDGNSKDVRALVGGSCAPINNVTNIKAMRIVGDSVMIVCKTSTVIDKDQALTGIFMSSPIYRNDGEIVGWTPWTRVFASGWNSAKGAAADLGKVVDAHVGKDGTLYFLAENGDASAINIVGYQTWNNSADVANYNFSSKALIAKLASDFGPSTPNWFCQTFPSQAYGVVAGTGGAVGGGDVFGSNGATLNGISIIGSNDKIAIVNTSKYLTTFGAVLGTDLTSADHYKLFSDIGVGHVLCAEMTRINSAVSANPWPGRHGFIFVGGQNGLFVLRKANGNGFDAGNNVAPLATLGTTFDDTFSFAKIPGISGAVYRLVVTPFFLYAMTATTVYRIRLQTKNFANYLGAAVAPNVFYDANSETGDCTMFKDDMQAVSVDASVDLVAVTAASNVTNNKYNVTELVIQTIISADSDEVFCDMVNIPDTDAILLGSNKISTGNGRIRTLHGDSTVGTGVLLNSDATPATEIVTELSYTLRKMFVRTVNFKNPLLNNGYGEYIIKNTDNGLFGSTVGGEADKFGTIGNLVVLGGDIISNQSTLNWYDIRGTHYVSGGTNTQRAWIGKDKNESTADYLLPITGLTGISLPTLANDVELDGLATSFGNAIDGNSILHRIMFDGTTQNWNAAGMSGAFYALAHGRLENGQLLAFGPGFGVNSYE